jgi:endoglucanase
MNKSIFPLLLSLALPAFSAKDVIVAGANVSAWRGFNLLERFDVRKNDPHTGFQEDDFKWISGFGFNFVRLPLDYRLYVKNGDKKEGWCDFDEAGLKFVDQAIEYGKKYHIHVSINLHHAPGYYVFKQAKGFNDELWTQKDAQDAFVAHWVMFAKRYRRVPSKQLSFNLLNEPKRITEEQYVTLFRRTIDAIRAIDPQRLIIVDGLSTDDRASAKFPVPAIYKLPNVVIAARGYTPNEVTHYKIPWITGADKWPVPEWPADITAEGQTALEKKGVAEFLAYYKPWEDAIQDGAKVMVGELGVYNKTPHEVVLRWMESCFKLYKQMNIGWALWNFRGDPTSPFGPLDSQREDVTYEDFHGHKLDREMMNLLQKYRK